MDIEQLTKSQIILLVLFVSFVTSIATGIVTVTLMNQAPADVTRTIDHVVEKTVEKVVPGETRIVERVKEISNPTESDMAVSAIDKTKGYLVVAKDEDGFETRGFFVSPKGEAVVLAPAGATKGMQLVLNWVGASTTTAPIEVEVRKVSPELGVMIVAPIVESKNVYPYVSFNQAPIPSLGERVISIGYGNSSGVNIEFGNVTSVLDSAAKEGTRRFVTSLSGLASHKGALVVDVTARTLGIEVGQTTGVEGSVVVPAPALAILEGMVAGAATSTAGMGTGNATLTSAQ